MYLDPGHTQTMNIFFMESTLTLKDQIWDIFEFTEYDVNIAEHSRSSRAPKWMSPNLQKSEREYVTFYLRQDEQKRLYKREEYDILTYLGDMGGLLDIILLFGVFLSSKFVNRLFHAALVKQTYRIQHYLRDMEPYYDTKKQDGKLTSESSSADSDSPFGEEENSVANALEEEKSLDASIADKDQIK